MSLTKCYVKLLLNNYNQMMILIQQFRPIHFRASDISRKKKQNFAGFSHFYSISTDKNVT